VSPINKEPTYNLKVVIRETGIKPDTLRAWERRYGLPLPGRSAGGHRLYSQYDIETIKWLMVRQGEGLRINRAVKLWRSIEESGQDPLEAMPKEGAPAQPPPAEMLSGTTIDEMREHWLAACLDFNEFAAEQILAQAFARCPLETVCVEVLQKGLSQIGELWYTDKADVQQEHFTSALAIRRVDALIAAAPLPTRSNRILVACPPGEDHVFSPLLITLFLRQRGWDVVYLGANVPIARLEATIKATNPGLVILAAMQLHTAASLMEMAQILQEEGVPLAYGGRIFTQVPELRACIPGYFLGERLENVVPAAEGLLIAPPELLEPVHRSDAHQQALANFREQGPAIDAYIWDVIQTNGLREYQLAIANDFIARDIQAALTLGDMDLIQPEFKWLEDLLANYQVPPELFPQYIKVYQQALAEHLDERGRPILDWIAKHTKSDIIFARD
jgi:DNA-binding transcriptional MerR regulator/methylmalonyl-CoA mutase cobalamin-binding subunit